MVSPGPAAVRVRDKYTSRACNECQRRKRKCSGEKDCRNCRHWATECIYLDTHGPKPSRRASSINRQIAPSNWVGSDDQANSGTISVTAPVRDGVAAFPPRSTRPPEGGPSNSLNEPAGAAVRPRNEQPRYNTTGVSNHSDQPGWVENPSQTPLSTTGTDQSLPRQTVFECSTNFMTDASFFKQIDLLDRTVMQAQGSDTAAETGATASSALDPSPSFASASQDIEQMIEQVRTQNVPRVLRALDIFFANVHPHYPCMNENHLRAQASAFAANDTNSLTKSTSIQLATMLKYIMAVINILSDTSTQAELIPGWQEFSMAEKLFNHTTWLERANIVTVQTLLIKTLYFMYAGFFNSAYDTMGTTVRLCFQLGLHDEPSWGDDCKFYDRIYRRRVFWSVYCLNHNVAQTRGLPELLRESDINIALPHCVDDRMLYPECPALPEMPATSPIPYLLEVIKLTRLSSEVWTSLFGVRVQKPVPPEVISALDTKIVEFAKHIPASLRWPPSTQTQEVYEGGPAYIQNQGFVLHLRILYLRMLPWREEMFSLAFSQKTAQLCVDITEEIVEAVEISQTLSPSNRCQRHAYLHHLIGPLISMICIIVKPNSGDSLTMPAINLLNKSLRIITSFSHNTFLARRVIQLLARPIKVARDIIEARRPQNGPKDCAANPALGGLPQAQNPSWNRSDADAAAAASAANDWGFSLALNPDGAFQDVMQRSQDISMLWEDAGLDVWSNLNYAV